MTAGRHNNSTNKEWCTPPVYVNAVKGVFGGKIDFDPCSNEYSVVGADVEIRLPDQDGLKVSWNYSHIYVNPPYGNDKEMGTSIIDWLKMCAYAYEQYGSEVIALIPVAVNTKHWKYYIFGHAKSVCFLSDTRLKFLENGSGNGKGAPMACATVYWGSNPDAFYNVFIKYGAVVDVSHLNELYSQNTLLSKRWDPSKETTQTTR